MNIDNETLEWVKQGNPQYDGFTEKDIVKGKELQGKIDESKGMVGGQFTTRQLAQISAFIDYKSKLQSSVLNKMSKKEYRAVDDLDKYFEEHPVV